MHKLIANFYMCLIRGGNWNSKFLLPSKLSMWSKSKPLAFDAFLWQIAHGNGGR